MLVSRVAGGAELTVIDRGPGLPDAERRTIFEPFQRGSYREGEGIGICLSLVDRFARLHGGRAWVDDAPGGRAAFHVFLADAPPDAPDVTEPSDAA